MMARLAAQRMRSMDEGDEIFFPFLKNHLPDPLSLPDIELAFEQVYQCLLEKRPIGVWGDYDVDGACSSALLVKYFRWLGLSVTPYIPDRFQEGYGPNTQGLQILATTGIRDVFIVDCGTTSFIPLAEAARAGMTVTVIDHHRVGSHYPQVHAFINPKRYDFQGPEEFQTLCAGGLVFCFLVGLNRYLRWKDYFDEEEEPSLFQLLDLVALSTVCDMMPLRHVNRAFVKQGLKVMRQRKNVGLTALIDSSGIKEAPTPVHLGYTIGPRINAGGRIGDSSLGVRLLSCEDKRESLRLAQELNQLNLERRLIERQISEEALAQAVGQENKPYLFVYGQDWHEGVLGIIASHLKESFYKPTFVMTAKGPLLKGSVRSVLGVDAGELIHIACEQDILLTGGGHPMAGGLTIEQSKLPEFLKLVDDFLTTHKAEDPQPPITIDMALSFEQLQTDEFFQVLDTLSPFGADYPHPRFLVSNIKINHVAAFGYNHLRMYGTQMNGQSQSMIYFRQAHKDVGKWLLSQESPTVDCVVTVQIDYRWGYRRPVLIIEDIR